MNFKGNVSFGINSTIITEYALDYQNDASENLSIVLFYKF